MKRVLMILLACLLILPAQAETVQDQALAFVQDAGIAADSVMRVGNDVIVTLLNGGTAVLNCPGDFDSLNLSWRFDGATDADVALYLDHALRMLSVLDAKSPADGKRAQAYAALVDSGLEDMTVLGAQGSWRRKIHIRQQNSGRLVGVY